MAASQWPRTIALIGILGISQASISGVLVASWFVRGMRRLDSGAAPTLVDHLLDAASHLFCFPLVLAARLLPIHYFPGLLGWGPFILNGLLWASVVVLFLRRRRQNKDAAVA